MGAHKSLVECTKWPLGVSLSPKFFFVYFSNPAQNIIGRPTWAWVEKLTLIFWPLYGLSLDDLVTCSLETTFH